MCVLSVRSVRAQTSRVYTEKHKNKNGAKYVYVRSNCFENKLNK